MALNIKFEDIADDIYKRFFNKKTLFLFIGYYLGIAVACTKVYV